MTAARSALAVAAVPVALAAVFGASFAVGAAAGPTPPARAASSGHDGGADAHGPSTDATRHDTQPAGLSTDADGMALRLAARTFPVARPAVLAFTIDADGRPLTAYRTNHERDLHLVVVSRDLTTFRHVHPERGADGTWRTTLTLPRAGTYRVLADFVPATAAPGAPSTVLGADLFLPGDLTVAPLPAPATTSTADGYTVAMAGAPRAGRESVLGFAVTRGGTSVRDLEPYLGSAAHLVALRAGDVAYLHTHPQGSDVPADGVVRFATTFPSAGTYRLFLEISHRGAVRTVPFTVEVRS